MDNNDDHVGDAMSFLFSKYKYEPSFGLPQSYVEKSVKIRFVGGIYDGKVKSFHGVPPDVFPVRIDDDEPTAQSTMQLFSMYAPRESKAVAEFYAVAVYELVGDEGEKRYRFAGYSEMMEGL